ncbi:MAG: thioredoxin family protein [Anaerolineae bacterium]|nr:thioredoxin family protein [Anaerolineae bacterium]
MPKPPILPVLDWQAIFQSGHPFERWLQAVESDQNRDAIVQTLADQAIEPHIEALLAALPRRVYVVAIAEDWCGDVRRHVPVLQRLAQAAPKIEVRYISREQHKDVFVRFLTNGGEAIPKFIFLSDQFVECGNWGPMPAADRILIARGKACGDVGAARHKVSTSYQADADRRIVVEELLGLINVAVCASP